MIVTKQLRKSFGNHEVLKGIDQHIEKGEKVVVIGPSGSGKSTFLRCLVRRKRAALPYGPRLFREHKASIPLEPQDSRGFLFPAHAALPFPYRRGELSVLRPDRAERVSATPSGNFTIV